MNVLDIILSTIIMLEMMCKNAPSNFLLVCCFCEKNEHSIRLVTFNETIVFDAGI